MQDDSAVPVVYVVEDPHGVSYLFLVLDSHPVRESTEVLRIEIGGHGQIQVRRVELVVQLVVESGFEFCR